MRPSRLKGFFFVITPAIVNWSRSRRMCRAKITPMILMKTTSTPATLPLLAISRKIPKI